MGFKGKSIISIADLKKDEILEMLDAAESIDKNRAAYASAARGKLLATLFFEPSTRTRLSFEASMLRLGGQVVGFGDPSMTSVKKGETLADSVRVISGYADAIVIRHPHEGAARLAAESVSIPVINAGDGANQHPTQTLLDLYTIRKRKKDFSKVHIGFLGDLKYGRTVHSLAHALSYFGAKMSFVSPETLRIPSALLEELRKKGVSCSEHTELKEALGSVDVLYCTRIQRERILDAYEYAKTKQQYVINSSLVSGMKKDAIILHPLPRVDELNQEVDKLPQAVYFEQADNGIPVRMAILAKVLGVF